MSDRSAVRPRRRPRAALPLLTLLALALAVPAAAAAVDVQTLVDLAETKYGMGCAGDATQIDCVDRNTPRKGTIRPGAGAQDSLLTTSGPWSQPPLDEATIDWMWDMHQAACGTPKAVDAFIHQVGALTKNGELEADIGTCHFVGGLYGGALAPYAYNVRSTQVAQPTPRPTATPTPTPKPTPKPTPTPSPTPVLSALPTLAPTGTPAATSLPTDAPVPTTLAPPPSPTAGPAQTSAPTTGPPSSDQPPTNPPASEAPGAEAGPEAPKPPWQGSVLGISEVNTDGGAAGASVVLALLVLLMIGFIGELFNNTVENNYDEIAGWFSKGPLGAARQALGRIRVNPPGRPGVLGFIALTAVISSFVDPGFGLNVRSIAVFLGFLVGLIVVLASFKLPPILARRRRTGELAQLRPLPWALVVAAVFVLVSRLANLQPGYLYGIVLGAIFVGEVSDRDEGRETFLGSLWTLAAAMLAWIGLTWLRGLGLPENGFGATLLSTAFAATLVAGLEAAAFALMPLRFLPGYAIYRWNRPAWAILWGVSLFAFLHILIGPMSGYVAELSPQAFVAALGVFAAFGALSIGTWLYFRFRHRPALEPADG